jgi:hypothetical protein
MRAPRAASLAELVVPGQDGELVNGPFTMTLVIGDNSGVVWR